MCTERSNWVIQLPDYQTHLKQQYAIVKLWKVLKIWIRNLNLILHTVDSQSVIENPMHQISCPTYQKYGIPVNLKKATKSVPSSFALPSFIL